MYGIPVCSSASVPCIVILLVITMQQRYLDGHDGSSHISA